MSDVVEKLKARVGQSFDGEATFDEAEVAEIAAEIARLRAELAKVASVVDNDVRLMDPPDGGDPTTAEKVANLRAHFEAAEARAVAAEAKVEEMARRVLEREDEIERLETTVEEMGKAAALVVSRHAEWRKCMPDDWEGDPLSDAIAALQPKEQT